jgi:hypothetical protein
METTTRQEDNMFVLRADITHLTEALQAAQLRLAIAERRRPQDVAGASVGANIARVLRARAKVERLERLIREAS